MANEADRRQTLSPTSLAIVDAARLLTTAGGRPVTAEVLQSDIDTGAPTNPDGTLNLVHYAAWLVKQMAGSAGERHGD